MTTTRKRGRPKKPTPEFALGPSPGSEVRLKEHSIFSEMLASIDAAEADLIGSVRRNRRSLTKVHALGLALENELDETARTQLLAQDFALRKMEKDFVKRGGKKAGQTRKIRTDIRVQIVWKKNQQLISKIRPNGHLSISRAAEILLNRWDELGDGGETPSLITARRWLKKLITSS